MSLIWLASVVRGIIIGGFFCVTHLLCVIHTGGWEHDPKRPHTYYALLHKRDADPFFLLPALVAHRGLHTLADLRFGLRGDAFSPGFLARMLGGPRWLVHLVHPVNVGPLLRWLGVHPLESFFARPAVEWIRTALEAYGDTPLREVLHPRFIAVLAQAAHADIAMLSQQRLRSLLGWRYQAALGRFVGAEIFVPAVRHTLERAAINRIKAQYGEITVALQKGGSLLGSPEGELSRDGRIGSIRGGFGRIVRAAPDDLTIVPIAMMYDFATTGRLRVFITVASPIENAHRLPNAALQVALHQAWLRHATLTCTQLGSAFLLQGGQPHRFTTPTLDAFIAAEAEQLATKGQAIDPALQHTAARRRRIHAFLRYAQLCEAVRRIDATTWEVGQIATGLRVLPGEVGYDQAPFAYAWNEYREIVQSYAPRDTGQGEADRVVCA